MVLHYEPFEFTAFRKQMKYKRGTCTLVNMVNILLLQRNIVVSPKIRKMNILLSFGIKDKTFPTNVLRSHNLLALKFELSNLTCVVTP